TAIVGGEGEPPPPEVIRSWQTDALSPTAREIVNQPKVFKQRLTEAIAYKNACVRWEQEFKSFIDLHRNRLFLELREGRLPADGIKAKKGTSQALLKRRCDGSAPSGTCRAAGCRLPRSGSSCGIDCPIDERARSCPP